MKNAWKKKHLRGIAEDTLLKTPGSNPNRKSTTKNRNTNSCNIPNKGSLSNHIQHILVISLSDSPFPLVDFRSYEKRKYVWTLLPLKVRDL